MNITDKINYSPAFLSFSLRNNDINKSGVSSDFTTDDNTLRSYSQAYTSMGKANLSFHGVVKVTPDKIKVICSEYASGKSLEQVALVMSGLGLTVCAGHISKIINMQDNVDEIKKQHNDNNQTKRNIVSDEVKAAILSDYSAGMTHNEIAKKYGCSKITVKRTIDNSEDVENLKNIHIENSPVLNRNVTEDDIKRMTELYADGFSSYQIGDILGFSACTIRDYLNNIDNYDEINKMHARNNKSKRFIQTDEFRKKVIEDYKNGKTAEKIAQEFGCTARVITTYLNNHADAEEIRQSHIDNKQGIAIMTEEKINTIAELFAAGMRPKDIAKKVGCSSTTVKRYLSKLDNYDELQISYYKNSAPRTCKGMSVITADMITEMIKLYSSGYTCKFIAKKLGCSGTTVAKYVKGNENFEKIEQEHIRNNKSKFAIITEDKILLMESMYRAGKTGEEIAPIVGCTSTSVYNYLKELPDFDEVLSEHEKNYEGSLRILTDKEVAEVLDLYSQGKSSETISKMFGCCHKTILNKVEEAENSEEIKKLHNENRSNAKEY